MNIKETREEIIKRSKLLRERQKNRAKHMLEGAAVALMAMLIFVIRNVPYSGVGEMDTSFYGTLLQGRDVGIDVIVGVICFVLGVIITLITIKYRSTGDDDNE